MQALIDGLDQSKTLGQQVHGADAPARDGMCLVGNVVLNVAGAELGLECNRVAGFVEPTQDAALEFVEPAADNDLHLKSFRVRGVCRCCYLIKHRESPKDFKFFKNFQREAAKTSLLQGLLQDLPLPGPRRRTPGRIHQPGPGRRHRPPPRRWHETPPRPAIPATRLPPRSLRRLPLRLPGVESPSDRNARLSSVDPRSFLRHSLRRRTPPR